METLFCAWLIILTLAIVFVSIQLYNGFKIQREHTELLMKKVYNEINKQKNEIQSDVHQKYWTNRNDINTMQRLLYVPLYERGNTIYFIDCSQKHTPEISGIIKNVNRPCGELPEYTVTVKGENMIIKQSAITGWHN